MAGLPENTTYSKENIASIVGAMKGINQSIRKRYQPEGVDVSQYKGLADKVKSSAPVSAPSSIKNLGRISTPYGGQTRYEQFHPGVDLANKIGTKIPAFTSGKVSEVVTGKKQGDPGYGNYVIIVDPQGNQHRFSHLNNSYVSVGQQVSPGMVLGEMGNTGQTYSTSGGTGSHLDYRIKDAYNKYVDPYKFINQ